MSETFSRFDAADYLKTDQDIAAYLEASSAEGDPSTMAAALGTVARARNISQLARDTGMTREGIYKALSRDALGAAHTCSGKRRDACQVAHCHWTRSHCIKPLDIYGRL